MNIEECLTDGDFVPLKLRTRTGNGDEEEDMAEEQDDDTHESPTSQDQKAMSLFYSLVKGCMKTFLRSSTLQHRMIDEHVIQSNKETFYERAKQGYAKRLEEGSHANPALQTKFESRQVASYFSRKEIRKPQESTLLRRLFAPHVSYQLNVKPKEHLQMKIKDLRIIVRELKLGVEGRKKDDVIQVLSKHTSDCQL